MPLQRIQVQYPELGPFRRACNYTSRGSCALLCNKRGEEEAGKSVQKKQYRRKAPSTWTEQWAVLTPEAGSCTSLLFLRDRTVDCVDM